MKLDQFRNFISSKVFTAFGLTILLTLATCALELIFPFVFQAFLIKHEVIGTPLSGSLSFITEYNVTELLIAMVVLTFFKNLILGLTQYLSSAIVQNFRYHQREMMVNWILNSKKMASGNFISLFGETVNNCSSMLLSLQNAAIHIILSVVFFVALAKLSLETTLISFFVLLTGGFIFRKIIKYIRHHGEEITKEWEKINKSLTLIFKNVFFIRIYGMSQSIKDSSSKSLRHFLKSQQKYQAWSAVAVYAPPFFGILVILVTTSLALNNGLLQKSVMLPYLYIFFRFSQAASIYIKSHTTTVFFLSDSSKLFNWWKKNIQEGTRQPSSVQLVSSRELDGPLGWQLSNVSFKYPDSETHVFKNLSLVIPHSQVTVVTGRSGQGKSTLLSLLVGELEPSSGEVLIITGSNNHREKINAHKEALANRLGYVGPENLFFSGTLKQNLLFGLQQDVDDQTLKQALEMSNCDFIAHNWKRLDEVIGDLGEGLSSGQRQRISLARALLRKPTVLLLDEPTSNLDQESQNKFIESLKKLRGQMTILLISHREELLNIADHHINFDSINLGTKHVS